MTKPSTTPRQDRQGQGPRFPPPVRWNDEWTESVPPDQRRRMANIRSTGTTPEIVVRRIVHRLGCRYRLHRRDLPGTPDLVLTRHRKIIDVRGCYWHAHWCQRHKRRTVRQEYWGPKLARNVARDRRNLRALRAQGWRVLVVWECEVADTEKLERRIADFLGLP